MKVRHSTDGSVTNFPWWAISTDFCRKGLWNLFYYCVPRLCSSSSFYECLVFLSNQLKNVLQVIEQKSADHFFFLFTVLHLLCSRIPPDANIDWILGNACGCIGEVHYNFVWLFESYKWYSYIRNCVWRYLLGQIYSSKECNVRFCFLFSCVFLEFYYFAAYF